MKHEVLFSFQNQTPEVIFDRFSIRKNIKDMKDLLKGCFNVSILRIRQVRINQSLITVFRKDILV